MVESIEQSKKMLRGWLLEHMANYEQAPNAQSRAALLWGWT